MSDGRTALFAFEVPRERRSFFPFCGEETSTNIYQLKLGSTSCVQLETPLMIIHHCWSLLGRESWSRWIPQGKPECFLSLTVFSMAYRACPGFPPAGMPFWLWACVLPEGWQWGKSLINLSVVAVSGITLGLQLFNALVLPLCALAAAFGGLPSLRRCSKIGKVPVCSSTSPSIQPPSSGHKAQIFETQNGTNFSHKWNTQKKNMLQRGYGRAGHTPGFSPGLQWPLAAGQGLSISQWFFPCPGCLLL